MDISITINGFTYITFISRHYNETLRGLTDAVFFSMREDGVPCERVRIWTMTFNVRRSLGDTTSLRGGAMEVDRNHLDQDERQLAAGAVGSAVIFMSIFSNLANIELNVLQASTTTALEDNLVPALQSLGYRNPRLSSASSISVGTIITPTHAPTMQPTETEQPTYAPEAPNPYVGPAIGGALVLIFFGYVGIWVVDWKATKEYLFPKKVVPLSPEEIQAIEKAHKHLMVAAVNPWRHLVEPELELKLKQKTPKKAMQVYSPGFVAAHVEPEDECDEQNQVVSIMSSTKKKKELEKDRDGREESKANDGEDDSEFKPAVSPKPTPSSPKPKTQYLTIDGSPIPPPLEIPPEAQFEPPPVSQVWVVKSHPAKEKLYYKHPQSGKVTWKRPTEDAVVMQYADFKRIYENSPEIGKKGPSSPGDDEA